MIQFWGVYCQFFVNFWESMSEAKIDATGAAERMRKYRKKNQLKNGLTIAKQQFKRAQLLASGTPEGKKLRQDSAERKRRQRMRAK